MTDLIVIGAGPAGLEAATEARTHGAQVLLLDENPAPGGRIWQGIDGRRAVTRDDRAAKRSVADFRASGTDARFAAAVWAIEGQTVFWTEQGTARSATAPDIILATGTTERPMPVPGWTLPGVMTVGAAQILLKTGGLVPTGRTWLAGQGPLLLLYAVQALDAGGRIAGVLDLSAGRIDPRAVPGALRSPAALVRGRAWRRRVAAAGVPWVRAARLEAWGTGHLQNIAFQADGRPRIEPADSLLLHDGVIPSTQLSRALGCTHEWDRAQACWRPATDRWGQTSRPGIAIAGDGAGVAGWQSAALSGRIAALAAMHRQGRIDARTRDDLARPALIRRARHQALRPLLDALFPPLDTPIADTTIACRCEEVPAGRIREAARLGCLGLNQLKAFTRAGMGPCQGRMCAPTLARLLAQARHVPPDCVDPLRMRFPTKPLTLGELATLDAAT